MRPFLEYTIKTIESLYHHVSILSTHPYIPCTSQALQAFCLLDKDPEANCLNISYIVLLISSSPSPRWFSNPSETDYDILLKVETFR